jgi:hypothetical protein
MTNRNISTPLPEIELLSFSITFHNLAAFAVLTDDVSTKITIVFFLVNVKVVPVLN